MVALSFKQFQATRIECDDLGEALGDATLTAHRAKGFLYLAEPGKHLFSGS